MYVNMDHTAVRAVLFFEMIIWYLTTVGGAGND